MAQILMRPSTYKRLLFYLPASLVILLLIRAILPPFSSGPSWTAQRQRQRKEVRRRVEAAGGWAMLEQECRSLFSNGQTQLSLLVPGFASNLPPAIASLRAREIKAYAAPDGVPIARLRFFGMQSSGGQSSPYYGLWVVCAPVSNDYTPKLDFGGRLVTGKILRITNSVFEVY